MYLTNVFYAEYVQSLLKEETTQYIDCWKALAENPDAPLIGADKTHPLHGMSGC